MLEAALHLMLDAVDMTATVVMLLALWEGRRVDGWGWLWRWLAGPLPVAADDVERFVAAARSAAAGSAQADHESAETAWPAGQDNLLPEPAGAEDRTPALAGCPAPSRDRD